MIEPTEDIAHIDPFGKDKTTGYSNYLRNFLLKCECRCESWQLFGWSCMGFQTRNDQEQSRKSAANWKVTGQGHQYGSVRLLRALWVKCWLEGSLKHRTKKWHKGFLWGMLYSRQEKSNYSLSLLIFWVQVQMDNWRRSKGKQQG